MDNQEYLNQISAQVAPKTNKGGMSGLLHSKFVLVGIIGIVGLILLAIVGAVLNSGKSNEKSTVLTLRLHVNSTVDVIDEYQKHVKSSILRSSSASLKTILSATDTDLKNYISEKYTGKSDKSEKKIEETAAKEKEELLNELFNAKINGLLDRTYAHQMAYQITNIMNEETSLYNSTKNDALKEILSHSFDSLENLYSEFNDFSETK